MDSSRAQVDYKRPVKRLKSMSFFFFLAIGFSSLAFITSGCSTSSTSTTSSQSKSDPNNQNEKNVYNSQFDEKVKNYVTQAKTLLANTEKGVTAEQMLKDGHELMSLGTPIIQEFIEYHPECQKYLETVLSFSDMMTKLSLEEIESQFHVGEALPNADDHCVTAKELVVHPATAIILANDLSQGKDGLDDKTAREKIKAEIEEVLAHVDTL